MPKLRRAVRSVLARLSYANVMSTLAVFVVLGGGAYAAATLPAGSVGPDQLRAQAVARDKLALRAVGTRQIEPGAVTIGRLSDRVRAFIAARGRTGPAGPQGVAGAAGERGAAGPGASLVRYAAASGPDATRATVLDMAGLKLQAACTQNGDDVGLTIGLTPSEAVTVYDRFTADQGTEPNSPASSTTGNLTLPLPGGEETVLGGPATHDGDGYVRAIATVIAASASRTITLDIAAIADATNHRCTLDGTAVPATG